MQNCREVRGAEADGASEAATDRLLHRSDQGQTNRSNEVQLPINLPLQPTSFEIHIRSFEIGVDDDNRCVHSLLRQSRAPVTRVRARRASHVERELEFLGNSRRERSYRANILRPRAMEDVPTPGAGRASAREGATEDGETTTKIKSRADARVDVQGHQADSRGRREVAYAREGSSG